MKRARCLVWSAGTALAAGVPLVPARAAAQASSAAPIVTTDKWAHCWYFTNDEHEGHPACTASVTALGKDSVALTFVGHSTKHPGQTFTITLPLQRDSLRVWADTAARFATGALGAQSPVQRGVPTPRPTLSAGGVTLSLLPQYSSASAAKPDMLVLSIDSSSGSLSSTPVIADFLVFLRDISKAMSAAPL